MSYPSVQSVQLNRVRTNLDGTSLPARRKAYALAAQGGIEPTSQVSATYTANQSIVTVFNGVYEEAYFCNSEPIFDAWQAFVPPNSFGSPETSEYEVLFVKVPGADTIAGLCAANP